MLVPNWTLMDCSFTAGADSAAAGWQALAARSVVPSGLNSPELILPALRRFEGGQLAVVRDHDAVRMVLPVARRRFPLPLLGNWTSPINFPVAPHLDADMAVPALTAFLRQAGQPVILQGVPHSGPFWDALTAAAGHIAILDQWQRAGLELTGSYAQWFERNFERKRRKEYRRLRARLSEQGRFEARSLGSGADTGPWVDAFLDVEAAGWKGDGGTAIKADPRAARALGEAARGLAAAGKLRFWQLSLDGRAVAMLFAVVEGGEAWLGKIAHDPAFARFSPGVLLILHATEQLFAEGGIVRVDSCAIPDHPMIDGIWRGRIAVADVMLAATTVGAARFSANLAAELLRRRLRVTFRDLFYKLSGRHRS